MRRVVLVAKDVHGLATETTVRMRELAMGQRFRIETDGPDDHLVGQRHIYEALSEPYQMDGVWGVDVRLPE